MDDNNQQGQQQQTTGEGETKGSGHRGDQGQQSHDTSRLERDGHEFPRTGEAQQSNNPQNQQTAGQNSGQREHQGMEDNDSLGDHEGSFDDAGQGDPSKQEQAPLGSTNPSESHDSWRPSADPAAGDMATERDRDDVTP